MSPTGDKSLLTRLVYINGKGSSLDLVVFMIREYFANKQGQKRPPQEPVIGMLEAGVCMHSLTPILRKQLI